MKGLINGILLSIVCMYIGSCQTKWYLNENAKDQTKALYEVKQNKHIRDVFKKNHPKP